MDIQKPTGKVYKNGAILVGTFLGGPLVAGYFIAENFKAFGEYGRVKKTWIYTIVATIIIFAGIVLIPDNSKIPNGIIPLIYTGIAFYLFKHFQRQNIEIHIDSGGELFGWWRTIGIGLIGFVITMLIIVFLAGIILTG